MHIHVQDGPLEVLLPYRWEQSWQSKAEISGLVAHWSKDQIHRSVDLVDGEITTTIYLVTFVTIIN